MALEESIEETDKQVMIDGIRFVYDPGLSAYMDGLEIDHKKTMFGDRFSISHPGAANC
ncbi:hypothetical protein [Aneurinibacillus tyrosinisolvens]|uniref:hypothetical protein n=1 Tax=Aneurinibacillus tyrosinisolvens TaxID=1443435 RepID=UPI000A59547A|nr:hypothetical protein [Aneurinibacillus tyrosinisolvens]